MTGKQKMKSFDLEQLINTVIETNEVFEFKENDNKTQLKCVAVDLVYKCHLCFFDKHDCYGMKCLFGSRSFSDDVIFEIHKP